MEKSNKGFSLVELIIVIAIMAILVGLLVPFLIVYVEKTNVSSDIQLADTVRSAMLCAATDARVVEDPASQPYLSDMEDGSAVDVTSIGSSVLKDSFEEIIGMTVSDIPSHVRSAHGADCKCMVEIVDGGVQVELTSTDCTGRKNYASNDNILVK